MSGTTLRQPPSSNGYLPSRQTSTAPSAGPRETPQIIPSNSAKSRSPSKTHSRVGHLSISIGDSEVCKIFPTQTRARHRKWNFLFEVAVRLEDPSKHIFPDFRLFRVIPGVQASIISVNAGISLINHSVHRGCGPPDNETLQPTDVECKYCSFTSDFGAKESYLSEFSNVTRHQKPKTKKWTTSASPLETPPRSWYSLFWEVRSKEV